MSMFQSEGVCVVAYIEKSKSLDGGHCESCYLKVASEDFGVLGGDRVRIVVECELLFVGEWFHLMRTNNIINN